MTPARVEAAPRHCATCKHHSKPQWDTGGFGACWQIGRLGLAKAIGPKGAYMKTHERFGCEGYEAKR